MRARTILGLFLTASLGVVACGDDETSPPPAPPADADALPAAVIITSPTGLGAHATTADKVSLAGVTLGEIAALEWSTSAGKKGPVLGDAEWVVADIPLEPGENVITVSAPGGASASITVLRNKKVGFVGLPELDTPGVFVGQATPVRVTVEMDPESVFDPATVALLRERDGKSAPLGKLYDDGDLAHGDEIAGDYIFSGILDVNEPQAGIVKLRAAAEAAGVGTEMGPQTSLSVVEAVAPEKLVAVRDLQAKARAAHDQAAAAGKSPSEAMDAAVAILEADPEVLGVTRSDGDRGALVVYRFGMLGALNLAPSDQRGGYAPRVEIRDASVSAPAVARRTHAPLVATSIGGSAEELVPGNNQAFLASAYLDQFGATDENPWIDTRFEDSACPRYEADGVLENEAVTFDAMRTMSDYGFVSIVTHGDTFSGIKLKEIQLTPDVLVRMEMLGVGTNDAKTRDMLWLRGGADDANLARPEVMVGLLTGALVMDGADLGVTARFFRFYVGTFKDSFVSLGACRSLRNGDIAQAILAKGAKAVVGYSDYVNSAFAETHIKGLLECLLSGQGLAEGKEWTVENCFVPDKETDADPAEFRVVPKKSKLQLKTGFRNGGFERGKIAWVGAGDARVLPAFGGYKPTEGKRVGIVSTGLGYTDSSGSFSQTFCIPEGTKTLSFDWNYISAEFMSYCGTQYQDTLVVAVIDEAGGETRLFERTVDSLCGMVGASSANIPQEGDPDGTYATGWQSIASLDVSAWAGTDKDVTLVFGATDVGDSIYDTAILIDNVALHQ
jgi:hypothetical protein